MMQNNLFCYIDRRGHQNAWCPFHAQESVKKQSSGSSLVVQWLRLCASSAGGVGSIPGQGAKIPHATGYGQKLKVNE